VAHEFQRKPPISFFSLRTRKNDSLDEKTPVVASGYRGTSLIRKRTAQGPYRSPMPRVLGGSYGFGRFLMGEVPLYEAGSSVLVETRKESEGGPLRAVHLSRHKWPGG
jgi:hypothetical protein